MERSKVLFDFLKQTGKQRTMQSHFEALSIRHGQKLSWENSTT